MSGREIAASPSTKGEFWKKKVDAWMPSIRALLPATIGPERMARLILVTFQKNPKLMDCTEASIYSSIMDATKLGLEIDCAQQAWLVPYGNQCQLLIGYQGLLQLVYNSGMVSFAKAEVVRDNDHFEYAETNEGTQMRHVPHWRLDATSKPGELMAAYAQVTLPDGTKVCQVYGRPTVERHRDASQSFRQGKKDSPWFTAEEEMWKKTAIRIISKLLPKSTTGARTVMAAVELDEKGDSGTQHTIDADFSVETEKEPQAEPAQKPTVAEGAKPDDLITADESKALFAMAEQVLGATARDVIRATLKAHKIQIAAKIPRRLYAQIWSEVEAGRNGAEGSGAGRATSASTAGFADPGPGDDPVDQGELEI